MEKILINIDSRQRDLTLYPSSSYFRIGYDDDNTTNYGNFINFKNIDYIKLASAEIPNNFYVFSNTRFNNFFTVKCILVDGQQADPNIDEGEVVITFPNGTYDADVLANSLNIILKNNFFSTGTINDRGVITITNGIKFFANTNSSRLTISSTSAQYKYEINFNNNNIDYRSFGYILGFRKNSYIINANSGIVGEAVFDTTGEKYLFLRVNNFGLTYINHKNPKKVFAKVILDKYKEDFVYSNLSDMINKEHKFRLPINVNKLEIELLDYNGNRIDNNGMDFSITLELGQIYDETLYNKSFNYIKMRNTPKDQITSLDIIDNQATVEQFNNEKKDNTELDNIFEKNKPQIISVPEIINIEEKRKEKKKKHSKKDKDFSFDY